MIDGVQEYLDCAREIRATNRAGAFLGELRGRLGAFERAQVASELATGVTISSGQAFLKLGIATTILAGAALIVSGGVDFLTYFAFLLIVTRVYDPINVVLQSSAELMEMRHSIRRTNALAAERPMTGAKDFRPQGHDVAFRDVSFSYGGTDEAVLADVTFTGARGRGHRARGAVRFRQIDVREARLPFLGCGCGVRVGGWRGRRDGRPRGAARRFRAGLPGRRALRRNDHGQHPDWP